MLSKLKFINPNRRIYLTAFGWVLYYRQSKKLQIVSTLNTEGNMTEIFVDQPYDRYSIIRDLRADVLKHLPFSVDLQDGVVSITFRVIVDPIFRL